MSPRAVKRMANKPFHPAVKLVRPSLILGAVLMVVAGLIYRDILPLMPKAVWVICLIAPGGGLMLFGVTVHMAARAVERLSEINKPGGSA